jgi:hypothetical protein
MKTPSPMSDEAEVVVWRGVPEWPEYEVSNMGGVRRVSAAPGTRAGRDLSPWIGNHGYYCCGLSRKSKVKTYTVHSLVARAFLGEANGLDVCHKDGNRLNPKLSNLRYDTRKANLADMVDHGTKLLGERKGTNKHSEETIRSIKTKLLNGAGLRECSREFSIPLSTIQAIKEGRIWAWLQV